MYVDITALDRWVLAGLQKAGIPRLLGTDSGTGGVRVIPGCSIRDELRMLVANGFASYAPSQTGMVIAATVVERMRRGGDFGTIEEGKRADLISVQDNPLEDITTMKAARRYGSRPMVRKGDACQADRAGSQIRKVHRIEEVS